MAGYSHHKNMNRKKEPLSDKEVHEIAEAIKRNINRDKLTNHFGDTGLWLDEQLNKSTYTKKDLAINKLEIADGETLQRSIDRLGEPSSSRFLNLKKRLLSVPSCCAYRGYLEIRKALGIETHRVATKYLQYFKNPLELASHYLSPDGLIFANGTYSEAATLSNNNVMLIGAGWGTTIIDGGTTGHAINITGSYVMIKDLQAKTDVGGGNAFDGIHLGVGGDFFDVTHCFINGSDNHGIHYASSNDLHTFQCYIYDPDLSGIKSAVQRLMISNNYIRQAGSFGIDIGGNGVSTNHVITGNLINTTGDDGIFICTGCEDNVVDGNRITSWTNQCIDDDSATSTVGDNECT